MHLWIRERIPPQVRSQLAQKALHALHQTSKIEEGDLTRLADHLYQIFDNLMHYRFGVDNEIILDYHSQLLYAEDWFSQIVLSAYVLYLRTHAYVGDMWIGAFRDRFPHLIDDWVFLYDLGWIFRDTGSYDRAYSLYVICFHQITYMQRQSVLHPLALRVLGDVAYQRLLQKMHLEASTIYEHLLLSRRRVLGWKHVATAGALLGLAKIGREVSDSSINYNSIFSQLYEAFEIREAVLGTEDILTRNVLTQLLHTALILKPPEESVLKEERNPFAIILQQLTREHDELTSLYGEHSTQATDARAEFASGQACFGMGSLAEEMLQKIKLQAMSIDGQFYYVYALVNLARRSMAQADTKRAHNFFSRAVAAMTSFDMTFWKTSEYERLADSYLRDDKMGQAAQIYYEVMQFAHIRNSSCVAPNTQLSFVRAIFALLPDDEMPLEDNFFRYSDYVAKLLAVHRTDGWFKSLLIMLHGRAQYLKGEVADASSLLEHAYQWMASKGYHLQWEADFYFFLGQISRFLGHAHFASNREDEAIAKMLEAYKYNTQALTANSGFNDMGAYVKIWSELLSFIISPQDELALIGTTDGYGNQTGHAITDETSWAVDAYHDVRVQAYFYENGMEEVWRSRAAVLESLRIDHSHFCPVRRSIFDQFYCPVPQLVLVTIIAYS